MGTGMIFVMYCFQEDGEKKIELKPGFLMEHDESVNF